MLKGYIIISESFRSKCLLLTPWKRALIMAWCFVKSNKHLWKNVNCLHEENLLIYEFLFIHLNDMLSIMGIITNNTMGSKTIHKRFSLGHLLCLSSHCGSIYSMLWSSSWTCVKWKIKTDHFLCIRCFSCYVGILMRYMTYCILSNMTTYNKYAQDTSFSRKDAFTISHSYWVWYYTYVVSIWICIKSYYGVICFVYIWIQ